jgi:hypothetical protein
MAGEKITNPIKGLTIEKIIELSGFKNIDLLKVDIEGAETELFKGDLTWLLRIGSIAIEFHGDSRQRAKFDAIIQENRFRIYDSHRHTLLAVRESY